MIAHNIRSTMMDATPHTEKRSKKQPKKRKKESTKSSSADLVLFQANGEDDAAVQHQRARKLAKLEQRMAALGLDVNGAPLDNFSLEKYPVRECTFTVPGFAAPVALNPVVTMIGIVGLWGLVLWLTGTCALCSARQHREVQACTVGIAPTSSQSLYCFDSYIQCHALSVVSSRSH
jgi:hypothetical protein